jgi:hypothetical protein
LVAVVTFYVMIKLRNKRARKDAALFSLKVGGLNAP